MKGSGRGFFSALTASLYTGNALGMDGDGIAGSFGIYIPPDLGVLPANGMQQMEYVKGRGTPPTPLFPKISDGGLPQEGLVWSSVQFLGVQYQL